MLITHRNSADTFNLYNEIFTQFDEATRSFGLEKIKTVCAFIIIILNYKALIITSDQFCLHGGRWLTTKDNVRSI